MRSFARDVGAAWGALQIELDEILEADHETVFAEARLFGSGKTTSAPFSSRWWLVYKTREGRIAHLRPFLDRGGRDGSRRPVTPSLTSGWASSTPNSSAIREAYAATWLMYGLGASVTTFRVARPRDLLTGSPKIASAGEHQAPARIDPTTSAGAGFEPGRTDH
jgi:hypothetical protein